MERAEFASGSGARSTPAHSAGGQDAGARIRGAAPRTRVRGSTYPRREVVPAEYGGRREWSRATASGWCATALSSCAV